MAKRKFKSKALAHAYDKYVGDDAEKARSFEDELLNARIARQLYELRKEAGLSQQALADLVETQKSVISRLEDADYEGHSLTMLRRIADALDKDIEVNFVPRKKKPRRGSRKSRKVAL